MSDEQPPPLEIAIALFDRFTALDAIGPYEVLSRLPGARVRFVAHEAGAVHADTRMLTLVAEARLEDVPSPDVLVIPGGIGSRALLGDERMLDWIRGAHERSLWTTSVCTGSLLLAAAGVLDGLRAATHWAARDELAALGVRPAVERTVREGKIVTGAGVSAGIDMALRSRRSSPARTSPARSSSRSSTLRSRRFMRARRRRRARR
jgi:putative intracellular protease/amidase